MSKIITISEKSVVIDKLRVLAANGMIFKIGFDLYRKFATETTSEVEVVNGASLEHP